MDETRDDIFVLLQNFLLSLAACKTVKQFYSLHSSSSFYPARFLRCYFFLPSSVPVISTRPNRNHKPTHPLPPTLSLLFSSLLDVLVSYCVLYYCNIPAPPLFLSFFLFDLCCCSAVDCCDF